MIINKQRVYLHAIVILSVKETISLYTVVSLWKLTSN